MQAGQAGGGSSPDHTFLFSDIADSTRLWEEHPESMADALAQHDDLAAAVVADNGGSVFKHTGDGFAATFATEADGVRAAVLLSGALLATDWPGNVNLECRLGLHAGPSIPRAGDYFGRSVNLAARIMDAGTRRQVLVSERVRAAVPADFEYTFVDEGSHQLKGITDPVRLHSLRAVGLVSGVNAAVARAATVPVMLTELLGRDEELAAVEAALAAGGLVTLVGPPGTGKTRLAMEVAQRAVAAGHSVHVVELAAVRDPDEVAHAVAQTVLGVDPIADPAHALRRLQSADLNGCLLLLDNCEHLLAASSDLASHLLTGAPELMMMATSRERLDIAVEESIVLEPLAVAARSSEVSPAVQLFLQRARQSGARLESHDLPAVARICERLDGVPLAIELAAARMNVLSVQELDEKLFTLLSSRRRRDKGDARHSTIDEAVQWSWDLLDDDERLVLSRASVFVDSFDLDAATAICGADEFDVFDLMDILGSLRDRSFLSQVYNESGNRFRLLQIIRSVASRKQDAEDLIATRDRHQEYYLQHALLHVGELDEKPAPSLMQLLNVEHHNYLSALGWTEGSALSRARRLAVRLQTYWQESGQMPEGYQHNRALVDPEDPASGTWISLLGATVTAAVMVGELPRIEDRVEQLAEIASGDVSPRNIGSYFALGFASIGRGRFLEASDWFSRASVSMAGLDNATARQAKMIEGACHCYRGVPEEALPLYREAQNMPQPQQAWFEHYHAVFVSSALLQQAPERSDASLHAETIDRELQVLDDLGLGFRVVIAINQATFGLAAAGAFDALNHWWARGLASARDSGYRWAVGLGLEVGGWAAAQQSQDQVALNRWALADAVFEAGGFSHGQAHLSLGAVHRDVVSGRSGELVPDEAIASLDLSGAIDEIVQAIEPADG